MLRASCHLRVGRDDPRGLRGQRSYMGPRACGLRDLAGAMTLALSHFLATLGEPCFTKGEAEARSRAARSPRNARRHMEATLALGSQLPPKPRTWPR